MNKNRIEGAAEQGERAMNREALVIKAKWRRSGGCAAKGCVFTRGDLASCLKGRRPCRSEKSAEVVVVRVGGRRGWAKRAKDRTRVSDRGHADVKGHASDAGAIRAGGRSAR
jgi:hypothetical protein